MKKIIIIDIAIIFLLGLLPLLWLRDGSLLLGHDAGLALDPLLHFLDRIHVWSQRFSLGTDQNGALLGAFLIHGFEAVLAYLGFSLHLSQLIQFIFWFTLPGLSMYFFASKVFPDKRYLPLVSSVIYMLNFYLLQGWFIAERTKFSIYIAFPLVLYFMIAYLRGKMGFFRSALLTGIVLGIFNGGGSLPLYGGLIVAGLVTIVYVNLINLDIATLRRTVLYTIGVGISYVLLNAYWVVPYVIYLVRFAGRDLASAGGPEGALTWARYLSGQSTFTNLFRGQGIPDWYLNPYHAYAREYLSNPLLIFVSFLLPILAFASLWFVKSRNDKFFVYLIVLICLVGMIFASGPQSQFGFIFEALTRFIPGFAMFRSAFFKFIYVLWFAYGILIGFTIDALLSKLEFSRFKQNASRLARVIVVCLIVLYIGYHYPVLNGSFLDYSREPGKELTTRVKVPDYVLEFGKWVKTRDPNERYLVMPQLGNTTYISYQWKYWSLAPLNSLLSRNSFVHNNGLAPGDAKILMEEMYTAFLREDFDSFADFTDVFAIDKIVLQRDYDWKNNTWGTINPATYLAILKAHPDMFFHEKTFGKWDVYGLAARNQSIRVSSSNQLSFLQGKLGKLASFPYFAPKSPLYMSDIEAGNAEYYAKNATDIYLAPECMRCDLEDKDPSFNYYNPKLLPGSLLYPLVTRREERTKASSKDFLSLLTYYMATSNRRIIEVNWMIDTTNRIDKIFETLERYRATLIELKTLLARPVWSENAKEENRAAQLIISQMIKPQVGLLDTIYKDKIITQYHRLSLAQSYNELTEIRKYADSKSWVTEDTENKRYIYDLPLTGVYEMFVKRGSLTNPEADASSTAITFKDTNEKILSKGAIGDWLVFGPYNFTNKKAFIELFDGTLDNLVETQDVVYPGGKQGITQDNNNFTLSVDSLNKCFYYQLRDLDYISTQYVVSFRYRNFSDKNNLSFFHHAEGDAILPYNVKDFSLQSTRYWQPFTKLITPKDGNLRLNFCNGFLSLQELGAFNRRGELGILPEGQTLIEIQDIRFHKVAYPNIVLYRKQRNAEEVTNVAGFKKNDPVTYTVNLDRPARNQNISLIMRESFGKYWRVCDEDNKCLSFDDKAHFTSAGFANAWYLKDTNLGKKLTIYYHPQRWFIIGSIITISSVVIIGVGFLCIRMLKIK